MQLREWQQRFQQQIFQPAEFDEQLARALQPGSIDKRAQLHIYSDAYVLRLLEALRSNYPALHQLLGDDDFDAMGKSYLDAHPPAHASIRWFGNGLSLFLAERAPFAGLPVLSELARFEWALRHTIDAADAVVVTVSRMQEIPPQNWGQLRFALHPAVTLLIFSWNAPQIWQALTAGQAPPPPQAQDMAWIIYRQPDLVGGWRSVAAPELAALHCLQAGGCFADICEVVAGMGSAEGDGAMRSAELLRLWVEQGLISILQ